TRTRSRPTPTSTRRSETWKSRAATWNGRSSTSLRPRSGVCSGASWRRCRDDRHRAESGLARYGSGRGAGLDHGLERSGHAHGRSALDEFAVARTASAVEPLGQEPGFGSQRVVPGAGAAREAGEPGREHVVVVKGADPLLDVLEEARSFRRAAPQPVVDLCRVAQPPR